VGEGVAGAGDSVHPARMVKHVITTTTARKIRKLRLMNQVIFFKEIYITLIGFRN